MRAVTDSYILGVIPISLGMVDIGNTSQHSERRYLKNQNIGVLIYYTAYYILNEGKTSPNMCDGERFNW